MVDSSERSSHCAERCCCVPDVSQEVADRHVAAPAIAASHILRIISSDKYERLKVASNLDIPQPHEGGAQLKAMGAGERDGFLRDVHDSVYGCILGAFVQGMEVIAKASKMQVGAFQRSSHCGGRGKG